MKVLCLDAQKKTLRLDDKKRPVLPKDGAIIQTLGCGLCGSDAEKVWFNKVQDGTVLGHEVVGKIVELGESQKSPFQLGDRVVVAHHVACGSCHYCENQSPSMCRAFKASNLDPGGFAEYIALSSQHLHHTCFKIPSHISNREASFVEPLACILRGVDRLGESPKNASAAVIGMGFIGMLAAQVLKARGYKTLGIDIRPERLYLSDVAGYVDQSWHAKQGTQSDLDRFLTQYAPAGKVDVVCLSYLSEATIAQALDLLRDGGQILLLAAGDIQEPPQVNANLLFFREINLISSYSPSMDSLRQSANWVFERKLPLTPLLTHPLHYHQADEGLRLYKNGDALKVYYEFS